MVSGVIVSPGTGGLISTFLALTAFPSYAVLASAISLAFVVVAVILMFAAVVPLRNLENKGWTLLFRLWLVGIAATAVGALLTLNVFSFMTNIIVGAL